MKITNDTIRVRVRVCTAARPKPERAKNRSVLENELNSNKSWRSFFVRFPIGFGYIYIYRYISETRAVINIIFIFVQSNRIKKTDSLLPPSKMLLLTFVEFMFQFIRAATTTINHSLLFEVSHLSRSFNCFTTSSWRSLQAS